jgi:cytochrome c oxidase cbb3-type subunit III
MANAKMIYRDLGCARHPIDKEQHLHRKSRSDMRLRSKLNSGALLSFLWLAVANAALAQENPVRSALPTGQPVSAALTTGRKSYEAHCAMCHGLDARGGEHAPGIANSRDVRQKSDKALFQIIRGGLPVAGMPSFPTLPENEVEALVKYLRSLSGAASVENVKGDPLRGEKLFFGKAQCSDCHMLAGKGGFIGPDLSDFAVSHSLNEIRAVILRPNEKLLPAQEVTNVETMDGQKLSGLVRNEDNFSMQLQGIDGQFHLLMKSQIAKVESTGHSLMPADYGTRLSSAELDDLVSFIARYGRRVEAPPTSSGDRPRRRAH